MIILGAPGSGKGTRGEILGSVPRFFHCACGDVFRSLDTRTVIGKKFVDYSSRGELARRMRKRALKDNRLDDASARVSDQRIATYEAETKPILDYYPTDRVTSIDATQPPVKVLAEMIQRITSLPVYEEMAKQVF